MSMENNCFSKLFDSFETHCKTMYSPWGGGSLDKFQCMFNYIYRIYIFRKGVPLTVYCSQVLMCFPEGCK